mmetsp:Transcript_84889/g.236865  ORF Transcript_84889/g.236865 Transcript_84889/m.236865 type:complete len:262 (-) Transcript_84889:117-902(-)
MVEHNPLATKLLLIFQHLVETRIPVRVLRDDGTIVTLLLPERLRPTLQLVEFEIDRKVKVELRPRGRPLRSSGVTVVGSEDIGVSVVFPFRVAQNLRPPGRRPLDFPGRAAAGVYLRHDIKIEDVQAVRTLVEAELRCHEWRGPSAKGLLQHGLIFGSVRRPLELICPPLPLRQLRAKLILSANVAHLFGVAVCPRHLLVVHLVQRYVALLEIEIGGCEFRLWAGGLVLRLQHGHVLGVEFPPAVTILPLPNGLSIRFGPF